MNEDTRKTFPWERKSFAVTRHQVRGGRVMAGLSIAALAALVGSAESTVRNIEMGRVRAPAASTMTAIQQALEAEGIEFGPYGWVRRKDE